MKNREGFSLIELILAIVIIAISVMTIPLMLAQSSNNDSFSIMQESLLATRTKMGNILSYEWDRNSVESNSSVTYIRVLDVRNGDSELDRDGATLDENRRVGHVAQDFRRRFHDGNMTNKTFPTTDGNDINITALNHFDGQVLGNVLDDTNASTFDYVIRDFNMSTEVCYVSDTATYSLQTINDFNFSSTCITNNIEDVNNSTNIKMVEIFVQSSSGKPFRFRAYSSNIGQTELLELDTMGPGI